MNKEFSQEYLVAIGLIIGSVLKLFGIEIENGVIEGILIGLMSVWIAVRRKKKGDINILGKKI